MVLAPARAARGQEREDGDAEDEGDAEVLAPGEIPPGYEKVSIVDLTTGLRDDDFSAIEVDSKGVAWLTSFQGRVYRKDAEDRWTEATVIPERRVLYGFAGQRMLLGALRSDGVEPAPAIDLSPAVGGPPGFQAGASFRSGIASGLAPSPLRGEGRATGLSGVLTGAPNLTQPPDGPVSPLAGESASAAADPSVVLGAALSKRAPRLSILLLIRRRPIANISLGLMLLRRATKSSTVGRIIRHPTRPRRLFATSLYGLFRSMDGGVSWFRAFPGLTPSERYVYDVSFDPEDPDRAYMGTSRGLYISDDGGESWRKSAAVPEVRVHKVAVDPEDPRYVYVATHSGMYRSEDRGANFLLAYYNSLWKRRDIQWVAVDPFEPERVYLATRDGLVTTDNARTGGSDDWRSLAGLRTVNLVVPAVEACSRHPGHLYAMTRADLPTINYGAHGPEAYVVESWDAGRTWRVLAGNRTQGDIRWFSLDPKDPDTIYVAFKRAVVRIERSASQTTPHRVAGPVLPGDPQMGDVILEALRRHGLDLDRYQASLDKLRSRNWLPSRLTFTARAGRYRVGGDLDDLQFADDRYLFSQQNTEWRFMLWGTWRLGDLLHRNETYAMQRTRVLGMNDAVRARIVQTIHRNYGELQRLRAAKRASLDDDLKTRVLREVRMEMLEAVVDLASDGYLSDQRKNKEK